MAKEFPKDPAALWREMLGQWEQGMNAMATQVMSSDDFGRDMGRVMGASLRMQKSSQEMLGRYFDALNLPTKDDLRALGERMQVMEEQLGRVLDAVEAMGGTPQRKPGAAPGVRRTRRYQPPGEQQS